MALLLKCDKCRKQSEDSLEFIDLFVYAKTVPGVLGKQLLSIDLCMDCYADFKQTIDKCATSKLGEAC